MEGELCDHTSMRSAALASLPTPVAFEECFSMWIPAADIVTDHNIDDILRSLAGPQQQVWIDARPQVRDFVRIPGRGISFVCTSSTTCRALGDVQLNISGKTPTIRKYS
uniref:Uncharacterized protein n=1 Tax=Globisporangium ultimum (strain ATCC 200006 / CBS 805.95 / DAOM BR144) TaxID=431595 RepID=K3XDJ0_GLOUD